MLLGVALAVPASASRSSKQPAPGVDVVVHTCYHDLGSTINTPLYAFCRGLQAVAASVGAICRTPLRDLPSKGAADSCALVDGRKVSEKQVEKYRHSWVHHALLLQRRLDARSPLYEAQFAGSHNTFNASSYFVPANGKPVDYYPTLTNQDPNQVFSIADQLRLDIRGIEIDLHWVLSLYGSVSTGGYWVDVCHGDSQSLPLGGPTVHVGCSIDRSFQSALLEVRHWLAHHKRQFLLIYLENQLDNNAKAHAVAASLIRQHLGRLVYQPRGHLPSGTCDSMPYSTSRRQMMRHGARVLLVGNCGPGAWNRWVFTRGDQWNEGGDPTTYGRKDCAADTAARESHSEFRRMFEESPFLEAVLSASQTFTPAVTRRAVHCGVNLTGWDQLTPNDGRLRAFVWSWSPHQPLRRGHCAVQGKHGRFRVADCATRHPFACVDGHLDWHVTSAAGFAWQGARICREEIPGSTYGVPPNGLRDRQLQQAKPHPHLRVWLDYANGQHGWSPHPARRYLHQ
ncbi:MAG: hypothetical protein JO214_16565 [Frankiaceae bacterium]|nr:hypothetical protein [Frankiaceae bacterium]